VPGEGGKNPRTFKRKRRWVLVRNRTVQWRNSSSYHKEGGAEAHGEERIGLPVVGSSGLHSGGQWGMIPTFMEMTRDYGGPK